MHCPKCGSVSFWKNGSLRGRKRYKCRDCGCQFTQSHKHGRPLRDHYFALTLYLSGLSMHATARLVGVSAQTVLRWVRELAKETPLPEPDGKVTEVEIDEMWHFIKKNSSSS